MTLCLPVVLQQQGAALVLSQQLHAAPVADCQRHHTADAVGVAAAGAVALQCEEQLLDWQMLCHGLVLQSRFAENEPWMMEACLAACALDCWCCLLQGIRQQIVILLEMHFYLSLLQLQRIVSRCCQTADGLTGLHVMEALGRVQTADDWQMLLVDLQKRPRQAQAIPVAQ